jgi:hypothetical protein
LFALAFFFFFHQCFFFFFSQTILPEFVSLFDKTDIEVVNISGGSSQNGKFGKSSDLQTHL